MRLSVRLLAASALALTLAAAPAVAQDAATIREAAQLRDRALQDNVAYALVSELTTRFGPRLAGSDSEQASARWGAEQFRAMGFDNVSIETFPLALWNRGEARVEILSPFPQPLEVVSLGGSHATPPEGIEGEAAIFETYQQMLDQPEGSLTGKIAVVLQDTVQAQDGRGYGATSPIRGAGPFEAAKRGAVGYVLRSLGTHDHRFAHTGATRVGEGTVPAFAMSPPDADQLRRLIALTDAPVRMRLFSTAGFTGQTVSQNVIGEVRGRSARDGGAPDEVIVIGGHLDSWDLGTGAIDDGAGVAITAAALKLIEDMPRQPRRTIRVVWWGSEEVSQPAPAQGLAGARFYASSRAAEMANHVAISESDFGAGPIYSLGLPPGAADTDFRRAAQAVLTPLGVLFDGAPATGGGPDTGPTVAAGVPAFRLNQDGTDYFDTHHTADDVLDRIDPEAMDQNVAAWAAFLWLLANSDVDFREPRAAAAAR
ncbi:MAG: M20/M25/M40 family metallo-hydrolase [Alphaproteobacteria bacterium]|jgi:carboxypeptidase Q|nr:M20/M25/M40 family metallo-hydrolase [Alphaproteobacteria bacterium]MBU2042857.1 M20/M25/M40 family metallo-hydrolase [Alphaproteobacteria bacterium]MBU2127246.1 M20/M25/M40 family metallo-hydrolase [Alphaproteobacteria bacterium]MBU2208227.1 M20/M25/M40 family metallo-hydrolase [Alphaproteobacteria bacterium]MBU2290342.1 M20/M25/M40 family metallo-hydrolase [Alphaproteobacteria bacterium]